MNIIYDGNKPLRVVGATSNEIDIGTINFYVPKYYNGNFYCKIGDNILKMVRRDSEKNYLIYGIALDNYLNEIKGKYELSILNIDNNSFTCSQPVELQLFSSIYTTGMKMYIIENLSYDINEKYNKILELTQMNIDIYKTIEEMKEV